MKRVLTIQDLSCLGKCSLTVALPIISTMGVECCPIPTALLSTHTLFKGFTFFDLSNQIPLIKDHFIKEKFVFDAIYTGYLGSIGEIENVKSVITSIKGVESNLKNSAAEYPNDDVPNKKSKKPLVIIDPCMADNGAMYKGFDAAYATEVSKLCAYASVILPNISEACFLTGTPYKECNHSKKYINTLLRKLSDLGSGTIVLKGVQLTGMENTIGVVSYNKVTGKTKSYFHEKLPISFHGTGDIFASVFTGALLNGNTIKRSYTMAADFVVKCIKKTLKDKEHVWYGVEFERCLKGLVRSPRKI